jgi:D-aminopeptidase
MRSGWSRPSPGISGCRWRSSPATRRRSSAPRPGGTRLLPPHVGVAVKRGLTRFAADSLHPEEARERVRAGAREAVERHSEFEPLRFDSPVTVEETFYFSQQADMVMLIPTLERVDGRTVQFRGANALEAYRTFIATSVIAQHPAVAGS